MDSDLLVIKPLSVGSRRLTKDFKIIEVECPGTCANSSKVRITRDYYEDLASKDLQGAIF